MSFLAFFLLFAVAIGLVMIGIFVWGHKHGVLTQITAFAKAAVATAAASDIAKVEQKIVPTPPAPRA